MFNDKESKHQFVLIVCQLAFDYFNLSLFKYTVKPASKGHSRVPKIVVSQHRWITMRIVLLGSWKGGLLTQVVVLRTGSTVFHLKRKREYGKNVSWFFSTKLKCTLICEMWDHQKQWNIYVQITQNVLKGETPTILVDLIWTHFLQKKRIGHGTKHDIARFCDQTYCLY